jgi:radical SAM superfamily enzyme YgiQ (UPF0313 family)
VEAWNTYRLAKELFEKGWATTLQATILIPYPGSKLHEEARRRGWLKTSNWDDYDMTGQVLQTALSDSEMEEIINKMYRLYLDPKYMLHRLNDIKNLDDIRFAIRGARKVIGKIGKA